VYIFPDEFSSTSSIPFITRTSTIFCPADKVVGVAGRRVGVAEVIVAVFVGVAVGSVVAVADTGTGDVVIVAIGKVEVGIKIGVLVVAGIKVGVALGTNIESSGFVPLKYSSIFVYPSPSISAELSGLLGLKPYPCSHVSGIPSWSLSIQGTPAAGTIHPPTCEGSSIIFPVPLLTSLIMRLSIASLREYQLPSQLIPLEFPTLASAVL